MTVKNSSVKENIIHLVEHNDALKAFFRNQQSFIHLYLLDQGCKVTLQLITEFMGKMDRKIESQTYYDLRRKLERKELIEYQPPLSTGQRGQTESPHFVPESKRDEFRQSVLEASTIERPVSINKFNIFDMANQLSQLTPQMAEQFKEYLKQFKADPNNIHLTFYPDFFCAGLGRANSSSSR